MKQNLLSIFVLISIILVIPDAELNAQSSTKSVGYIDVDRILQEDTIYRTKLNAWTRYRNRLIRQIKNQLSDVEQKLNSLKSDSNSSSDKNMRKRFKLEKRRDSLKGRLNRAQKVVARERSTLMKNTMERISKAAKKVSKRFNLSFVVQNKTDSDPSDQEIIYAAESMNITEEVINRLNNMIDES